LLDRRDGDLRNGLEKGSGHWKENDRRGSL
jgi:hypothetical protein